MASTTSALPVTEFSTAVRRRRTGGPGRNSATPTSPPSRPASTPGCRSSSATARSTTIVIQNCSFAAGHGGITIGSEMTGGVREVYARDLTMTSTSLRAGHRLKTNSVRGGFIEGGRLWRVNATAVGGPLLLIDYTYGEGDTGSYPPVVTDITLSDWTVATAKQGWNIQGYTGDPVGTVRLRDITVAGPLTTANVTKNISDLRLSDVVIDGVPQ